MKERKSFVVDTNVLLHDPESVQSFPNHDVVIPLAVIEELDHKKRLSNELGRNAREVVRFLDSLKVLESGNLNEGVELENASRVFIQLDIKTDFNPVFNLSSRDNQIIMAAYLLMEQGKKVVFVSKDLAARVKAEAVGIAVQDYENLKIAYEGMYTGYRTVDVLKDQIDCFYKDDRLELDLEDLKPNEYCTLKSAENSSAVCKYSQEHKAFVPLMKLPESIWGIRPLNVQQRCALDLLMRDDIRLVTLLGSAGTGKTLLALACALRKVYDEAVYSRILVTRPIVPLGNDIGYLPGSKEEKLQHWMQPIDDNLKVLCDSVGKEPNETLRWILDSDKIEMEAVTYIRGRSLSRMFMIIDEAQNLTPHEIKTIISRAGQGTKVVFTGDPTQIDNPYLDQDSNGLNYTVECFKDYRLSGHIVLSKTERSELAALAAEIM